MTALLTIVGGRQHGGSARAFGSWASAWIAKGALVALKLERAILRSLAAGTELPAECEPLADWDGGQGESPVFGRSTAGIGSINRTQHAAMEEEVADLRSQLAVPVMPGRPGALVGEAGYMTFAEYLSKLPVVMVETHATKGPSRLDAALEQIKMLRAALAASEVRTRLLPSAIADNDSTTQTNRPSGATEENHMATETKKTAAQLKKDAYIKKVVADDAAKKKDAAEKAKNRQETEEERAERMNQEWEKAGCLKGPVLALPGVPGAGMAWEFALRGANAVTEYKQETLSVVRAAGGEILGVKGANSGSALEIWVQVLGSLSDFVSNVIALAKANPRSCLRRSVEGLPGCERANADYALSEKKPFPIPEAVKALAIPIAMKGRKAKTTAPSSESARQPSTLPSPVQVRDNKPDTICAEEELLFRS